MKRAIVVALALLASCSSDRDTCADVAKRLKSCGVDVSSDLVCADRAATDAIAARLDERGCDGIATDESGKLDPRVCDLGGFACPDPPTPTPSGAAPKHSIVFVSGIDATPIFDWNPHVIATLRAHGIDARHAKLSAWASTGDRAADLWAAIEALDGPVNLVCYAVGGIDCRFLASPRGLFADDRATYARVKAKIASITTVATPHRGTRVADAALAALESGAANDILSAFAGSVPPSDGVLAKTLDALTVESMADFDDRVPDADGIVYQSYAGVSHVLGKGTDAKAESVCGTYFHHPGTRDRMNDLLLVTAPFAGAPSDGMVSVASAQHGEFKGCIPADHYDVIGQIGHVARDPSTGFSDVSFYERVASDLAERGL